jgi:hypothetical protein
LYQIVVVTQSPERRMKIGADGHLGSAINYAETFGGKGLIEIIDERTGLLRASIEDGFTQRTVGSLRRPVVA